VRAVRNVKPIRPNPPQGPITEGEIVAAAEALALATGIAAAEMRELGKRHTEILTKQAGALEEVLRKLQRK
jgi:hypothetical protein